MLVLGRKKGESIVLGENIRIIVSEVTGRRCTLVIDAPQSVQVRREELPSREEDLIQQTARNLQRGLEV
ncbi:MAG: carbon storage regulator [Planctomycetaceae bacterium]|nr:carbon storage regulator [Planctomycetaceae bacterium]